MDPVTAIGVASAIVQFVSFGFSVASKLKEEIRKSPGDIPGALESINTQLPLILNALSRIQQDNSTSRLDPDTRGILNGVVLGCSKLSHEVDEILDNLATKQGESLGRKLKKVLVSMKKEARITEINQGLLAYVQVLVLHQVVDKAEVQSGPPPETEYFEVKEKRLSQWFDRAALINRLDQHLLRVVRGQTQQPTWLVLEGPKGVGKTQLALEYSYHVYEQIKFRTIFWLDASTPENLKLSFENASSIVRRSRDGTREMKLNFFHEFLADRFKPWLLVVDGYDTSQYQDEPLTSLLPTEGHGTILVTTRNRTPLCIEKLISVYKYRTVAEYDDLRRQVTKAVSIKDLDTLVSALDQDLDVNCYTKNVWQDKVIPLVNHAAREGFGEAVSILLNRGANFEQDRSVGAVVESATDTDTLNTILDWEEQNEQYANLSLYQNRVKRAIKDGEIPIVETMLARRLKDFDADEDCYFAAFVEAAEKGRLDMFHALWSLDKMPRDELTKACMMNSAIKGAETDTVSFLLHELKCDVGKLAFGEPVLYALMQKSDKLFDDFRETVLSLLLKAGASPNVFKPSIGKNSFHVAASSGLVSAISAFIEHGGDVTLEDETGRDALRTAARRQITDLYPILANANIPDAEKRREYFTKALFHAARIGDRELALAVMKDETIIEAVDPKSGDTPLLAAIRAKNDGLPVARMLARKGLQQRGVTDRDGRTPLLLAAELGLALVVRDLARSKDSPGVNVTDRNGNTPLILAVRAGDEKTVETLLGLGADRDAMNKYGETAEDIAEERGMKNVLERLQGFELVN